MHGRREFLKTSDSAPHFVVRRAIRGSRACVLGGTESGASPGRSGGGLVFFLAQAQFLSPSVVPDHRYSAQVSLWYSLPNSLCRKGLRCFFRWVRSPAVKLERASDYFQIVFKSCRDVVDEPRGDRFMGLAEGREFEGPCLEPVFAASEGRGVFPW